MILHEFPDLSWLKRQINERFRDRRAINGLQLETDGFPSVIINSTIKESYRPDIKGPLSLFNNLHGISRCKIDGRTVFIPENYFFVTNRFQHYTLEIESDTPVETFNIHLGEYFCEGVMSSMLTPMDTLLNENQHQQVDSVFFNNQLYGKDTKFNQLINELRKTEGNRLAFEEHLVNIIEYLLQQHRSIIKAIRALPPVNNRTKISLYKRLSVVIDFLNTTEDYNVDLNHLSSLACLSKYHFLRLFKVAFSVSPYQYLQNRKIESAKKLLKGNEMSVKEVAYSLGFENNHSFSRLFYQRTGMYPKTYRAQKISNFGYQSV